MINYKYIDSSIEHYASEGFIRIESPWTVNPEVAQITNFRGNEDPILKGRNKCLVASGEQSFLYLMVKGFLPKGSYQTVTPCFRFNDNFTPDHSKYFIKNELIITESKDINDFFKVINSAFVFFTNSGLNIRVNRGFLFSNTYSPPYEFGMPGFKKFKEELMDSFNYALAVNNLIWDLEVEINEQIFELGSYGFRKHQDLSWIFGTGLAEPRFSHVLETKNNFENEQ